MLTRSINFDDILYVIDRISGHKGSISYAARLSHEVQTVQSRISHMTKGGAYVSIYLQAAMLLRHLTRQCLVIGMNHPDRDNRIDGVIEGDTRPAWILTAIFLEVNGYSVAHATKDEVCAVMALIIERDTGVGAISTAIQAIAEHPRINV
jgi:prophage maintenance system killer protein